MTRDQALAILGLDAGASSDDALEAYRDLSTVWQPERFEDNERLRQKALVQMRLVSEAYLLLSGAEQNAGEEYGQGAVSDAAIGSPRSQKLNGDNDDTETFRTRQDLRLYHFIPLFPFLLAFFVVSLFAGGYVGEYMFRESRTQREQAQPAVTQGMSFSEFKEMREGSAEQPEIIDTELIEAAAAAAEEEDADTDLPLPPDLPSLLEQADPQLLEQLMETVETVEEPELNYKERDRLYTVSGDNEVTESYISYTPNVVDAAILCDRKQLRKLIEEGADINTIDSGGNSALIWAVRQRCRSVVRLLLKHGADPNSRSANGFSAYVWARLYQNEQIMRLLKEAGADTEEGSYWWRNSKEQRLAWIEQSLKRLCKNGRCRDWARQEYEKRD